MCTGRLDFKKTFIPIHHGDQLISSQNVNIQKDFMVIYIVGECECVK